MGKVVAVCISEKKGIKKVNVGEGYLKENYGVVGDSHADSSSHRQVSLLDIESIHKMRALKLTVGPGDFAENITTQGVDFRGIKIGDRIYVGEIILEVTQIGKDCHSGCAIFKEIGKCIMPKEGIFTKVLRGGKLRIGDKTKILKSRGNVEMGKKRVVFKVPNMTCEHCVAAIKKALSGIKGVEKIEIDLRAKLVEVQGVTLPEEEMINAIQVAGYQVEQGTAEGNL